MSNPRLARVEVGLDFLCKMLMGHDLTKVDTDIPKDAVIYTADVDFSRRVLYLTIESASFTEVPYGAHIPQFSPTMTVSVTEMSMLADLVSRRHDFCKHCGEPLADPD